VQLSPQDISAFNSSAAWTFLINPARPTNLGNGEAEFKAAVLQELQVQLAQVQTVQVQLVQLELAELMRTRLPVLSQVKTVEFLPALDLSLL
jgi:hypothetical protein